MAELIRTNDLALIAVVEALLLYAVALVLRFQRGFFDGVGLEEGVQRLLSAPLAAVVVIAQLPAG